MTDYCCIDFEEAIDKLSIIENDFLLSKPKGIYVVSPFVQRKAMPKGKKFNNCPWCGHKL